MHQVTLTFQDLKCAIPDYMKYQILLGLLAFICFRFLLFDSIEDRVISRSLLVIRGFIFLSIYLAALYIYLRLRQFARGI